MIQNLLATLLGQNKPRNNFGDQGGYLGYGGISTPPIMAPSRNIASIDDFLRQSGGVPIQDQEMPPRDEMEEQQDVVAVRPRKRNLLEILGDAVLINGGMKPQFALNKQRDNMRVAMEGFTNDPLNAIRKMAQIDPEFAWKLYNQHQDDERASGTLARQNRALDMQNDRYVYGQIAGMMGSPAVNEQTWGAMRNHAINVATRRGLDPATVEAVIPKDYDPAAIDFIRYGEIKPKDQVQMENTERYRGQRLGQIDRSLDIREESVGNTEQYRERRLEQIDTAEEGRNARSANRGGRGGARINPKAYANRVHKDSNGSLVEFDKTGTKMKVTTKSGVVKYFALGVDGKPVPVGE